MNESFGPSVGRSDKYNIHIKFDPIEFHLSVITHIQRFHDNNVRSSAEFK